MTDGYTEAFLKLIEGNYTGAVTHGYTHGLQIGNWFFLLLIFALILPVYIKSRSLMMTAMTLLVLSGAGLMTNIIASESSTFGSINFIAIFTLFIVIGFSVILYNFLKRRE